MSKSLSTIFSSFFFLFCSSYAVMFVCFLFAFFSVLKIKQQKTLGKCVMLLCPGVQYLEAIKLNKENNTSLVLTLVNYFQRISNMFFFLQDFTRVFVFFFYFLNGISGLSLFTECFLYNYSILRKCGIAGCDGIALIWSLITVVC